MDVPQEAGELHDHDHLRAGDVYNAWLAADLAIDLVDGEVAHEEDEADPWHVWAVYVCGHGVCADGADEESANAIPKTEEADEIEQGHAASTLVKSMRTEKEEYEPYYEVVLVCRLRVGNALEQTCEWV